MYLGQQKLKHTALISVMKDYNGIRAQSFYSLKARNLPEVLVSSINATFKLELYFLGNTANG